MYLNVLIFPNIEKNMVRDMPIHKVIYFSAGIFILIT